MKSRITFLTILIVSAASVVSAQEVEFDDMYFRSKDRVVLATSQRLTMKAASKELEIISPINPTDSYSARNVNPEYLSQTKVNPSAAKQSPVAYFIPGFVPTSVNQKIFNETGYSNNTGMMMNPYSSFGMGMGGMNMGGMGMMNPAFYNPYNSFYSNPWMGYDPYGYNGFYGRRPGWSTSISMGWGMGMGGFNSWGGSPWNNFHGMNSWGMNPWGMNSWGMNPWGMGNGFNSWYQPQGVIINSDTNARNVVYGKRSSRSNDLNNNVTTGNRQNATVDTQGRTRVPSNGRVAGNENQAAGSYYQRGWRSNPETNSNATRSGWSNSNSGRSGTDSNNVWNNSNSNRNNSNSSWNNSNNTRNNSNSSFNNNSRSSGSNNFSTGGGSIGGGSRSSGGGSSSGGASRGRN
jgi:hypothetical protein